MTSQSHPQTILVVGASGHLGGLIAHALLAKPGVAVRCAVRPGSRDKASALGQAGAQLVEIDLADPEALKRASDGVTAVVSALQGGPDIVIDAQMKLLQAARAAGASRFIPSDFSLDFFGLGEGENLNSDWRRAFARAADAERGAVSLVHVLNGCFLDRGVLFGFLGAIDLAAGKANLWGDGNTPMNFTTIADTALFAAEAATASDAPSRFNVAGDTLDFHGLLRAYRAGAGRDLAVDRRGSLADLDAEIAARLAAEPKNFRAWLPLMYWRGMLNGKGQLGPLVNDHFPQIRPTTVEEYVRAERL